MRRFDKKQIIESANLRLEQEFIESKILLEEDYAKEFLRENLSFKGKEPLNESLILDIVSWFKTALTTMRGGELFTAFMKLLYKALGIDKDLSGTIDKCEDDDGEEARRRGFTVIDNCKKMGIQKLADFLEGAHNTIVKIMNWVSAVIKFKTLKPTKEQKQQSKGLGKIMLNTFIFGCLVYYLKNAGIDVMNQEYAHATFYFLGAAIKGTELVKKVNSGVHKINSELPN